MSDQLKLEDDKVFAAFNNVNLTGADLVNAGKVNAIETGTNGLSPEVAGAAFANVEQYDIPVANVVVNAQQQRDLRLWTNRNFDPVNKMAAQHFVVVKHQAISENLPIMGQLRGKTYEHLKKENVMPGDARGTWLKFKTPSEKAAIVAKQNLGRAAAWLSKPAEERQRIIALRKVSLKATWAKKPVRTNSHRNKTAEQRFGVEKASELRANLSRKHLGALNPMKRKEVREACRRTKAALPDIADNLQHYHDLNLKFRSSWEADFVRVWLSKGIPFEYEPQRFRVVINNEAFFYTPDFWLPTKQLFVEVKGRELPKQMQKYKAFVEQYPQYKTIMLRRAQYQKLRKANSALLREARMLERIRRDYTLGTRKSDDIVRPVQQCTEVSRNTEPPIQHGSNISVPNVEIFASSPGNR